MNRSSLSCNADGASFDALGHPSAGDIPAGSRSEYPSLSDEERDVLAELANISMGAAATATSHLLNRKVWITTPSVATASSVEALGDFQMPALAVSVRYITGLEGNNVFLLRPRDAAVIADLMMGGDGNRVSGELDDLRLSAVAEAMNQMMGASAAAMADMVRRTIDISPPETYLANAWHEAFPCTDGEMVVVTFQLTIEGLVNSAFVQLLPLSFARAVVRMAMEPKESSG